MNPIRRGCRVWRWWTGDRTAVHRLLAYLLIVAVGAIGFWDDARDDEREAETLAHRRMEAVRTDYEQCLADNAILNSVDQGYLALLPVLLANAEDDEERRRMLSLVAALRSGLRPYDCSPILERLPREAAEEVRTSDTSLPRLPLPPIPRGIQE